MLPVLFQLQDDLITAMNEILSANKAQIVGHNRICRHLRYYTSLAVGIPGA